jgi:Bifunctional DNA primase/polymerase, N-terminal
VGPPPERERSDDLPIARPDHHHEQLATTTNQGKDINGSPAGHLDAIGAEAVEYARHGWPVFPLRGKVPFKSPHAGGSQGAEHKECAGRCGHPGHGLFAATTDVDQVIIWWSGRYAGANIGLRLPDQVIVIDVDPRNGGLEALAKLEAEYGPLPPTLTTLSGRGDGGRHLYFRRPAGELSARRLGRGIDLKLGGSGYVVAAPSIHPASGRPYVRIDAPVATPPAWLIRLLKPEKRAHRITPAAARSSFSGRLGGFSGPSIADEYSANTSWSAILEPHGWTCVSHDPDGDGAVWLHPTHTSSCSATVRHGCLFVYSTSTVFDVTEPGNRNGYTRFRAYALLNHAGDMKAAARTLRGV